MARRKAGIIAGAGVVLVGGVLAGTLFGGSSVAKLDTGAGPVPQASGPEAPYAISTLPAIGNAPQDPGGGGGGSGEPGLVGRPGIQGPQGPGSPPGSVASGNTLYFSGLSTLDPNTSAVPSGDNKFGGPPLPLGGPTTTGCANPPSETEYYAIPLRNVVTYPGNPFVHMRISG